MRWGDCNDVKKSPAEHALLSELPNYCSLSQIWNPPVLAVQLPYPPLDEHVKNGRDENDAEARKEEGSA